MRLASFVAGLLAIAPMSVAAQTGAAGGGVVVIGGMGAAAQQTVPAARKATLCPVEMQASHLADGNAVKTDASHPKGLGQKLHLTLTSPDSRRIAAATLNVRGWTAKGRVEQAGQDKAAALTVRTLTAPFTAGADRKASATVWVPELTAVISVELVSVTFGDGTTWTLPPGRTCDVKPDLLMVITN
jgi:hypothetical protein